MIAQIQERDRVFDNHLIEVGKVTGYGSGEVFVTSRNGRVYCFWIESVVRRSHSGVFLSLSREKVLECLVSRARPMEKRPPPGWRRILGDI